MNKLDEIFKNNKELLNVKEVKDLIEYCQKEYTRTATIAQGYKSFHDRTLEKLMYSEIILKNGNDTKTVLTDIMQDINDM